MISVRDLDKQIFPESESLLVFCLQQIIPCHAVVMEQIAGDTGSLRLPVEPDAPGTVMEMIPPDDYVDCGMELDPADLRACKVPFVVDMMDMTVLNHRENTSQIAHDPCLAAVVDIASPDRMRSDRLLAPAIQLGNQRAVSLCLRAILVFISRPFVVIMLLEIFAK